MHVSGPSDGRVWLKNPYESAAFDLSESFVFVASWESSGKLEFQREMFYIRAPFSLIPEMGIMKVAFKCHQFKTDWVSLGVLRVRPFLETAGKESTGRAVSDQFLSTKALKLLKRVSDCAYPL